nr:retrovirus-related Pol polyprotein from transposon TNT 1-94 [Tanacetum cinerariifolium]
MNELVNDSIKLSNLEINIGFINGLPKKWLSFCQSLKNANHVRDSEFAYLFGKLMYEENLFDGIYYTKIKKSLSTATPLSTFSNCVVKNFQDSQEDTISSQEYMNDLELEFHERALLAKSKRFFKYGTQKFSGAKATTKLSASSMVELDTLQKIVSQKIQFLCTYHLSKTNLNQISSHPLNNTSLN